MWDTPLLPHADPSIGEEESCCGQYEIGPLIGAVHEDVHAHRCFGPPKGGQGRAVALPPFLVELLLHAHPVCGGVRPAVPQQPRLAAARDGRLERRSCGTNGSDTVPREFEASTHTATRRCTRSSSARCSGSGNDINRTLTRSANRTVAAKERSVGDDLRQSSALNRVRPEGHPIQTHSSAGTRAAGVRVVMHKRDYACYHV